MNEINFRINDIQEIKMSMDVGIKKIYPPIEDLEVTPTKEKQIFEHENSYGYDKVTVNSIPEIKLQSKEVTPTKELQEITADDEFDGLNQVTVNSIPDEYIIPEGTLPITENKIYDVTKYAKVSTNVHSAPNLQSKSITITENGTQNITYDESYDGLSNVEIVTEIEGGGGGKYAPRVISFASYTGEEIDYEIANLDTSNLTTMANMFSSSMIKKLDISKFTTNKVTTMYNMFANMSMLTSITFSENFKGERVTDFGRMFYSSGNSQYGVEINLPSLEGIYAKYVNEMFYMSRATKIDLSKLNLKYNCTSITSMFRSSTKVTSIDMRSFEGTYVKNCDRVFQSCTSLKHLDIRSFNFSAVTSSSYMFTDVPADCEIIVKDETAKAFILGIRSDFTNVKTLAEYEG